MRICQAKTEEALRCPKNRKNFDALSVYREFLENVSEFQKLNDMSVNLPFEAVSAQILFDKNTSWHHSCSQKFRKTRLERAKKNGKKMKIISF